MICPNLSLLENQTRYLNKLNLRAKTINSTIKSLKERRDIRNAILCDDTIVKFFYLCPEMAATSFYNDFLHSMMEDRLFSHVVIDEAHCLTDKGFRDSFSKLKEFRQKHLDIPFIALTTGSDSTLKEIQQKLGLESPKIIKSSCIKENIFYQVTELNADQEINFLDFFKFLAPDFESLKAKEMPTGIIYCQTYAEIEKTVAELVKLEVPATVFHAKLDIDTRFENYDDWSSDKYPIIVATAESFGLGIVKSCVKFVLHVNVPKNLRAYYQVKYCNRSYYHILIQKTSFLRNPVEQDLAAKKHIQ